MLSPRWHKVIRDLGAQKSRTALVVMAIAVGVFAFGSVLTSREVMLADMDTQYRATNSSSIIFDIPSFDEGLARWARRQEHVTGAQGRQVQTVKLLTADKTHNIMLNRFDRWTDMTMNRIDPETGAYPPGKRDILIERSSMGLTGADIGGVLTIELPDGRIRELPLAGIVHDLNAVPGTMWPDLTGYVSSETMAWLGFPDNYTRLELTVAPEFDTVARLEKVADQLKEKLQNNGVIITRVQVRQPGEHWGRKVMDSVAVILGGIGLFALFLSGFLVVNTVNSLMAQQRKQIGMMKLVGGVGRQIVEVYLAMMGSYGVLALLIALPVGMGLGYVFLAAMTGFLNTNILDYSLPPHILLLEVAIALLVPVLASIMPVVNGVRVTTREAISDYQARAAGPDRLTIFMTRLRGLPRPVLLSLRNTFRNRRRLALTMSTMTLAGVLFITVANTRDALSAEMELELQMWKYEVELNLSEPYPVREITSVAQRVPGVVRAEGRAYAAAQRILPDGSREATFFLIGLPPETEQVQPNMIAGRWLRPDDRNAIVLNTEITRVAPDLKVGDEITIEYNGQKYNYNVVGIASMFVDRMAYAPIKYMAPAFGDRGTVTAVDVDTEPRDSATQNKVGRALEKYFKDRGISISYWLTNDMIVSSSSGQMDFLVYFLLGMAAMSALIGGLGLSSALGINVMERTREIGVMRSVGATGAVIGFIVIVEGLFIGLVSWVLAVPLSVPTAIGFNTMLGNTLFNRPLSLVYTWTGPLIWLALVIVLSIIASVLPARRASTMSIRETLAYE